MKIVPPSQQLTIALKFGYFIFKPIIIYIVYKNKILSYFGNKNDYYIIQTKFYQFINKKFIYIYIDVCVCVWACQFIIGGGNLGEFIDWSTRLAGLVTKNVNPLLICLWEHVANPTLVPQYLHNLNFWNVSSDKLQKSYQLIFLLIYFINKFKTGFNYLWSSD